MTGTDGRPSKAGRGKGRPRKAQSARVVTAGLRLPKSERDALDKILMRRSHAGLEIASKQDLLAWLVRGVISGEIKLP
jgi:hypothetical protein